MRKRKIRWLCWIICLATLCCFAQDQADLGVISRIRYEGFRNSKVMKTAGDLVDGLGPRLTGSPNMKKANERTRGKLKEFGLSNVHLESWGHSDVVGR